MALENQSKQTVESLYVALSEGDTYTAVGLLVADIEWWFHGPPRCQHMMRMLTGETSHCGFRFEPQSVTEVGEWVVVEGWEGDHVYWVHVWTLVDGVITQFREYFNTWLTVRELSPTAAEWVAGAGRRVGPTLWQSGPRGHLSRSLPGLVLAI